jgi:5S rRNA maturation endonuclease (ribonuclease M5)
MPRYSQALVNQVTDECCDVIGDMMTELGVNYTRSQRRLFGACPVHGGDNPGAWNLYPDGDNVRGIWFCRTHNCHLKWKKTLVGFVHAMLCNHYPEKKLKWTHAVDWMIKFLGYNNASEIVTPDEATLERQRYNNASYRLNLKPKTSADRTWTPEKYRENIEVPSQYYLDRGYEHETLVRYDVGYSKRTNRSVVPVYNDKHDTIIGMTARTHYDKCSECGYYHQPEQACPIRIEDQINACKWKNSPGFEAAHFLYNLWFARPHIVESGTIILVEGPGDVWRLEEAGIKNSVAIFGTDLTEEQLTLIESSWAMNVIVLTDNDEAGKNAANTLNEKLRRTHRMFFPTIKGNDVGDLRSNAVTADIAPTLKKITKFNKAVGIKQEKPND